MIKNFTKVLVANRGEIAIRCMRAARELGMRTVGIFSEEDKHALHRYKADEAYPIGKGLAPVQAYLHIPGILELALEQGVDAIHPGYGFLAENENFASACAKAGIRFIGPPAKIIAQMGNKIEARKAAKKLGLPMVPGSNGAVTESGARQFAEKEGFPLILKAAYGGGGRGMRIARNKKELIQLYQEASRESALAFGKADLFIERYVERPKHIEVQILADAHGNCFHLFERDCSIQRRHQKIVELAPAPCFLGNPEGERTRDEICAAAKNLAKNIGYINAGTVEFLYEAETRRYYFMEMNTRIQVEHTVTEMTTGIDIVKSQIRIAEGYKLTDDEIGIHGQKDISSRGVAIQCRITTEDPASNFLPDYGRVTTYRSAAGHGVRLDAGTAHSGAVVTPFYDSLLVKISTLGRDLSESARRMDRALAEFRIRGVKTNIPFLQKIMEEKDFLAGDFRTDYLETHPELIEHGVPRDRASKLLEYIGEITVNKNPIIKGPRPNPLPFAEPPPHREKHAIQPGTKQILDKDGPDGIVSWIQKQKKLLITDTTFRDAHQSLLATRMRTRDMVRVAKGMAQDFPHMFSYEMWGGATFDTAMRFLKECPWERLSQIRHAIPNSLMQMLLRGANAVGYTNYPDNATRAFVKLAAEAGVDLFRIFDSLNWMPGLTIAIEEVRKNNKLAEAAICYTGNIEDPKRNKYSLKYYVSMAKELEKRGTHILGIKDMAGLLRPFSARLLVKALKQEVGIPIHLHTHDTAAIQGASILMAMEAEVDIADAAIAAMSGLTSQANLNSLVAALEFHPRNTGLDRKKLDLYSDYWEETRKLYVEFEPELRAGTASVYDHEMPGGQYTNLRVQAESLGLGRQWPQVCRAYEAANRLFGDIVKVTPSSKVVGDMALFMVANGIDENNFLEKSKTTAFPTSVIGMMKGELGKPPGGFPKKVQAAILKHEKPLTGRPGSVLPPVNLEEEKAKLLKKFPKKRTSMVITDRDVISKIMYPAVALEFLDHKNRYGDTSILPTEVFFYGMEPGDEVTIEIEEGKTLYLKLSGITGIDAEGMRTLFFELNGHPRDVRIQDKTATADKKTRAKADAENLHHVGSPLPGRVVKVEAEKGKQVKKNDPLFVLEAMKMQTSVNAIMDGKVGEVHVENGDTVENGDLLMVYQ